MPWPTTHGLRTLRGAEADLIRGAIGMMVDTHVAELREDASPWTYHIDWFDQWDAAQRLWLLEHVTRSMLGSHVISEPAAVFGAAADAVFYELNDLVKMELDEANVPPKAQRDPRERSWRQSILQALTYQREAFASGMRSEDNSDVISEDEWDDFSVWTRAVTGLADSILGIRLYRKAESFRDGDYSRTKKFLEQRGLPVAYLDFIPPLRSIDQTQLTIDRIQAYVFGE
ncbi:MAG: hypothetical protein AAF802_19560 [Planctomycetota bacterium]